MAIRGGRKEEKKYDGEGFLVGKQINYNPATSTDKIIRSA